MTTEFAALKGRQTLDLAMKYLSWGFIPIAISKGEKKPSHARWQHTEKFYAIRDIEKALEEEKWSTELNLGVVCGERTGLLVFDIDVAKNGLKAWMRESAQQPPIDTFTVRTGGGGLHLYFQYPLDLKGVLTGTNIGHPGWDIRSDGGQVLGPFSIHPTSGKEYSPICGFTGEGRDIIPDVKPMPDWLKERLFG